MGNKRKRSQKDTATDIPVPKKQHKSPDKASAKREISPTPLDSTPFLDNPKGVDLKREVELYNILSSEDVSQRINAANAVVSGLLGGDQVAESTLQRHLERKLFRGLASGRKGARLGFSIVLTEILAQLFGSNDLVGKKYPNLTFDTVLGFLLSKTKPDGDLSGQEEKDHYLGLLFGLQCFVRAKFLFAPDDKWNSVLQKLLDLAKKKPWMREECGWVVMEALAQMTQDHAEYTLEQLHKSGLALSPEGVGIWLKARSRFSDMRFPTQPWGQSGNPLENLKSLGKALKESSSSDADSKKTQQANQTGTWNPQLHFVWNVVLAEYALAAQDKKHGIESEFENFWKVAVDENLFSASASRERKFWGFLLFQKLLQEAKIYGNLISSIFSHNLVRCLINHVQEKDRFLNRAADKSLKVLIHSVESEPKLLPILLPRLIGGYGTYNFDKITKTKTVERLLSTVNETNVLHVINVLVDPALSIQGTTESEVAKEAELRRQLLGDHLLNIVRRTNVVDDLENTSWIEKVALPTLAKLSYSSHMKCQPALSEKSRIIFRNRLMSSFGHLLSNLNGFAFPCNLLQSFSPDAVDMDEGVTDAKNHGISTMEKILKKIKKAKSQDKPPLQALALLYSLVIFQLYNGEPEAASILDELKLCYDKLVCHKDTMELDADASEVLVELLLSFISKPSALLRKVAQHVFGAFMVDMTEGGLKLMTDVLQSDESLRGQQELFEQEPESGEQLEDVDNENESLDSDVEIIDMDGDEGHLNNHLNSDNDSDDEEGGLEDDEDEDEEDEDEAKRLDEALAKALGTHRLDQDAETESDSDADMTDSEMMALDSKLIEIFSQRKKVPNKKQEQKDAKETVVNFKSRVLDLLEIYAKKQTTNPLAFHLLVPLLQLMRTTKTKQLAEKAHSIIISFAKASKNLKKTEELPGISVSDQTRLMRAIHLEATKDISHVYAKAASTASLLVASSMYRADKGSIKKILKVYMESMLSWSEPEVKMQAAFFAEMVNWCQSHFNS